MIVLYLLQQIAEELKTQLVYSGQFQFVEIFLVDLGCLLEVKKQTERLKWMHEFQFAKRSTTLTTLAKHISK